MVQGQEARVPISKVILMTARIGARIKISQKEAGTALGEWIYGL